MKDLKEGLSSSRKADTTHVRRAFQVYTARPCEYGSDKYERANFMRATGNGPHAEPTAEDFNRLRAYARAARDHIDEMLESMEAHQAGDPNLTDVEGMKRAAYAVDTDAKPGQKLGPSLLPHIAPACASLMMAITQATACGLLPKDPGTPWRSSPVTICGVMYNGTTVDGRPYTVNLDALDDAMSERCVECPYQDGWCAGCPDKARFAADEIAERTQAEYAAENDAITAEASARLATETSKHLTTFPGDPPSMSGAMTPESVEFFGGPPPWAALTLSPEAYDRARMLQTEREMAERAKSLAPSPVPTTNHHDPAARAAKGGE